MKINHKIIRTVLSSIGIALFIVSIVFKLKDIFLYGGSKPVVVDDGSEIEALDDDEEYPELATPEAPMEEEKELE